MANLFEVVQKCYQPGDYILVDEHGDDVGVSGNADFWDVENGAIEIAPVVTPAIDGRYLIIKVVQLNNGTSNE